MTNSMLDAFMGDFEEIDQLLYDGGYDYCNIVVYVTIYVRDNDILSMFIKNIEYYIQPSDATLKFEASFPVRCGNMEVEDMKIKLRRLRQLEKAELIEVKAVKATISLEQPKQKITNIIEGKGYSKHVEGIIVKFTKTYGKYNKYLKLAEERFKDVLEDLQ